MFFKSLDLTTALRPLLLPDETLLFVQDAVGLYEGYVILGLRVDAILISIQEIQDPQLPEWSCLLDIASRMLCGRRRSAQTFRGDRPEGDRSSRLSGTIYIMMLGHDSLSCLIRLAF